MAVSRRHVLGNSLLGFVLGFFVVHWMLPTREAAVADGLVPSREESSVPRSEPLAPGRAREEAPEPARPASAREAPEAAPAPEEPRSEPSPDAPDGLVLHGRVVDIEGVPLDEAYVGVRTATGDRVGVKTDEAGRYTLGVLPLDTRRVTAGLVDYHSAEIDLPVPAEAGLLRQDFSLRPKQVIRVRLVTSTGEPALPAVQAAGFSPWGLNLVPVATRSDPGETFEAVTGSLNNLFGIGSWSDDGRMDKPDLGPEIYGTVTLHEDGSAWLSLVAAHQVLRKHPVEPSTREVTFVLDPEDLRSLYSGLSARMIDAESGAPLAGQFWLEDDPFPMGKAIAVASDGRVFIEDALPGIRYLVLHAEGRAEYLQRIELHRGAMLELGDLALHPPISLSGHVRTADGDPFQAELRWGRFDPANVKVDWVRQRGAKSGTDGAFELAGLVPGHWVVQSPGLPAPSPRPHDATMASLSVSVDATEGSVSGIELLLGVTTTITIVVEAAVEPWPSVTVLDEAKLPATSSWLGRWGAEAQLHLLPGSYELVFERDGKELERRTLVVGVEPQRIEWE